MKKRQRSFRLLLERGIIKTAASRRSLRTRFERLAVMAAVIALAAFLAGCGTVKDENLKLGMDRIAQMDYQGALESFEAALVNKEDMQMVYRGQGIAYMGLTDYENAASCLEKALGLSDERPDQLDFDINYYLATAYYKNGELDRASAVYEAITQLRPKEKTAWYLKGTLELEKQRQDEAKKDFDTAVAIDPADYDLRIDIYVSCQKYGYEELGVSYLEEVLADEKRKLSDYNMGRMSFYLGDYEQARLSLENAKEENGAGATSLLGQTYEKLGDYNYAASVYSSYLETKAPDPLIYNQLGLCKIRTGDYEGALSAFQAGISIEGNAAMQSLKFNEIVAYEYLGDFAKAKLAMEQYLALYPDDEKAQREYLFLKTR